jgi:hypothetical protein
MKAYLFVTGGIFGVLGAAHLLRLFVEPGHTFSAEPEFYGANLGLFAVGVGIALWAFRLLRKLLSQST